MSGEDEGETGFSAWDDDEYDGGAPPPVPRASRPAPPERASDAPRPPPREKPRGGQDEVRRRLRIAEYYGALDETEFFEGDASEEADAVRRDLREWVGRQMERLVGVGAQEAAPSPFSEEEVVALKQVAARVLRGGPSPSSVAAPPPASPRSPAVPPPKRSAAKPPPPRPPAKKEPSIGEVFEEGGKLWKLVPHPDDASRTVKINVTRQQPRPPSAQPMPDGMGMAMATERLADRAVRAATRNNPTLQKGLVAAFGS